MSSFRKILNSSELFLENISKPMLIYNIFLLALICYNLSQENFGAAAKNSVFLLIGSILIWLLVYLGFEAVAWVLLLLPIFFIVAILALLVLTQIMRMNINYSQHEAVLTGINFAKMFGFNTQMDENIEHDTSKGFYAPKYPDLDADGCSKPVEKIVMPPPIKPAERICGMLNNVIPTSDCPTSECHSCSNEVGNEVEEDATYE
jgi:hypothetical protein